MKACAFKKNVSFVNNAESIDMGMKQTTIIGLDDMARQKTCHFLLWRKPCWGRTLIASFRFWGLRWSAPHWLRLGGPKSVIVSSETNGDSPWKLTFWASSVRLTQFRPFGRVTPRRDTMITQQISVLKITQNCGCWWVIRDYEWLLLGHNQHSFRLRNGLIRSRKSAIRPVKTRWT